MQLTVEGITKERSAFEAAGYALPQYDIAAMKNKTKENPTWIHFGNGNLFRAFQANVAQELLNKGILDQGIIGVGGHEALEKVSRPHDNLSILITLKANGTVGKTVVGSVAEALTLDEDYENDFERVKEIFTMDSLQMASFTITEKGYSLTKVDGSYTEEVEADLKNGPEKPKNYMAKIAAFLYARYQAGEKPVSMVSMDNCSHNGTKLKEAVLTFAKAWGDEGFVAYLNNSEKVAFPWTMIDKITPRPDETIAKILEKDGIEGMQPIITDKKTYIAPFVNAEEVQYLVIADEFPNGRPPLEKGGVIFTDRETVDKVEKMKVCTCLNPLHTALAVFGCILGFDKISSEMKDPTLKKLVEEIGYTEGLPVVVDPGVLDPKEFIDTVLEVRLPNPFMPDTPQRIATDTSQKLAIRFGETVKAYAASKERQVSELIRIPLVFAGWLRYLMAVDDNGNAFELSPDPLLSSVCPYVENIKLGETGDIEAAIRPVLENAQIFGVNLYEVGLAPLVCRYFKEMITGPLAVRKTLEKYV